MVKQPEKAPVVVNCASARVILGQGEGMSKLNLKPPPLHTLHVEDVWKRKKFECRGRTFVRDEETKDSYTDGKIVVFHDQQCSTSWTAQVGSLRTNTCSYPEHAIETLLDAIEAAK